MKHLPKKALALAFMAIIAIITMVNIRLAWNIIREPSKKRSFTKRISQIQKSYPENIKWRTRFIEINGGFCRLIGKLECNKIIRLNNGMIARSDFASQPRPELSNTATKIVELSKTLKTHEIPFLYVNCPNKVDPDGTLLPKGITFYSNQDSDYLLNVLENAEVNTLDLRPIVARTGEDIKRYFYATDHHWNVHAALKVTPIIVNKVAEILSIDVDNLTHLNSNNWNTITRSSWWIGSEGKRVGSLFGGIDDLEVLTPKFSTTISRAIPNSLLFYKGTFDNAILDQTIINKRFKLHQSKAYHAFGKDYALVHLRNENAPLPSQILLVKDSFGNPVSGFLATVFKEIDIVDLRHYRDRSLLELIECIRPDIVIMLYNPTGRDLIVKKIGQSSFNTWSSKQPVFNLDEVYISNPNNNRYFFTPINCHLQNGQTYTAHIQSVNVITGNTNGTTIGLYNPDTRQVLSRSIFDFEYSNKNGGWTWDFNIPQTGRWEIILYAGVAGQTQNISMRYNQITVSQRIK